MSPRERKLHFALAQWAVQAFARILGIFALAQGLAITWGGDERWSGPSFEIAMKVPGSPEVWGIFILIFGVAILCLSWTRKFKLLSIALIGGSFWSVCFAVTFIIGIFINESAAFTAIVSYSIIALMFAIVGGVYYDAGKDIQEVDRSNSDAKA